MKQKYPTAALVVSLFLALLAACYFAHRSYFTPEALKRREVDKWVGIVGEKVELPRGERPTVATVTNRGKLGEQPFLQEAENGDVVLIYARSGSAVLYRPSTGHVLGMTTDIEIEKD